MIYFRYDLFRIANPYIPTFGLQIRMDGKIRMDGEWGMRGCFVPTIGTNRTLFIVHYSFSSLKEKATALCAKTGDLCFLE
jgi:hypothetical protein